MVQGCVFFERILSIDTKVSKIKKIVITVVFARSCQDTQKIQYLG